MYAAKRNAVANREGGYHINGIPPLINYYIFMKQINFCKCILKWYYIILKKYRPLFKMAK